MNVSKNDIYVFNLISERPDNNLDKFNLLSGHNEIHTYDLNKSLINLSAMKLIIIKNEGRETIIKLSQFYDAVSAGGLIEYIKQKEIKDKLENDLITSNIKTNKYSRISIVLTVIIGSLTLIALIIQIILQGCHEQL